MKRNFTSSLVLVLCTASAPVFAQLELPKPSPSAKVTQTIGLTDVTVEYSSPAVHGRKIWGGLVPYGQVWRTGANAATKITFSKDATVGSSAVPAGTYALFAIPNKASWTIILSKEPNQPGAFAYKKELDLARIEVKPQASAHRERLAYIFSDFSNSAALLDLEWEKLRVAIPIKVNTDVEAEANIKSLVEGAWMPYNAAARYMLEQKKDYDAGLQLVDKSLSIKEEWFNLWTKAQLLAAKHDYKEAYPLAQRSLALGEKSARFFDADEVKKALADWKPKL